MKIARSLLLISAVTAMAIQADTKVKLESLPAAVQAAVKEQTKNATLVGLSKETERGKTHYEVETRLNGKSRDITLDQTGAVLEVEEEVAIETLPAAAQAAIQKRAAGGTVKKVEKLTAGSRVSYEAAIKTKAGRNVEVGVNSDGTPHKE